MEAKSPGQHGVGQRLGDEHNGDKEGCDQILREGRRAVLPSPNEDGKHLFEFHGSDLREGSGLDRLEPVDRHFEVGQTVVFRRRQLAGLHVHLQRRHDQLWHGKLCIPRGAEFDKLGLGLAVAHVNVLRLLITNRSLPRDLTSGRARMRWMES